VQCIEVCLQPLLSTSSTPASSTTNADSPITFSDGCRYPGQPWETLDEASTMKDPVTIKLIECSNFGITIDTGTIQSSGCKELLLL
jgi:hypothetical protein